jgi:hypothetical protein
MALSWSIGTTMPLLWLRNSLRSQSISNHTLYTIEFNWTCTRSPQAGIGSYPWSISACLWKDIETGR